jgi:(p)ppGpp synthase/HD superfamily hydrolase
METNINLEKSINELFMEFNSEKTHRSADYNSSLSHAQNLWQVLLKSLTKTECAEAISVRQLAENLNYKHAGLGSKEYFLHPLRVGSIAGIANPERQILNVKVGMLHNIYEVTDLQKSDVLKIADSEVEKIIAGLTINRKLQFDSGYLIEYYGIISGFPYKLGIIKVIDKIDNLFTLNSTASSEIKARYLQEIADHVVPLCDLVSPQLSKLLRNIAEWVRFSN